MFMLFAEPTNEVTTCYLQVLQIIYKMFMVVRLCFYKALLHTWPPVRWAGGIVPFQQTLRKVTFLAQGVTMRGNSSSIPPLTSPEPTCFPEKSHCLPEACSVKTPATDPSTLGILSQCLFTFYHEKTSALPRGSHIPSP